MADANDITDAIIDNATGPKSMSGGGVTVVANSINDQIAAHKFAREQAAMDDTSGGWPLKTFKISPPSARGQ